MKEVKQRPAGSYWSMESTLTQTRTTTTTIAIRLQPKAGTMMRCTTFTIGTDNYAADRQVGATFRERVTSSNREIRTIRQTTTIDNEVMQGIAYPVFEMSATSPPDVNFQPLAPNEWFARDVEIRTFASNLAQNETLTVYFKGWVIGGDIPDVNTEGTGASLSTDHNKFYVGD